MIKTNRDILQENIVEDFELYKQLHKNFNTLIITIKEDYVPYFSFDEFYIRVLNHFKGIDDEFVGITKKEYIKRMFNAIVKLMYEELNDKELIKEFKELMKKEGF